MITITKITTNYTGNSFLSFAVVIAIIVEMDATMHYMVIKFNSSSSVVASMNLQKLYITGVFQVCH